MMKKVILVTVSLSIGIIIGYLYREYSLMKQTEVKSLLWEGRKQYEDTSTLQYPYYTGEEDWENLIFQEYTDLGPV